MFKPKEVLDIAIRIEKNGEAVYRHAVQQVADPNLKQALVWMADEEADHMAWFSALKDEIKTSAGIMEQPIGSESLADFIGDQSFTLKDVDFSRIRHIKELVLIFIEFEKDSILFYEMLTPFVKDVDTLEQLKKIIDEENQHITQLEAFIKSDTVPR